MTTKGQGGAPSGWAMERARALRKQLCKGRDPLLTNVRVYPDPTAEIEDALARVLDAARAEEREKTLRELEWTDDDGGMVMRCCWCGHSASHGHSDDCRLAAALRARGEEAGR